jgi:hypothetical protein
LKKKVKTDADAKTNDIFDQLGKEKDDAVTENDKSSSEDELYEEDLSDLLQNGIFQDDDVTPVHEDLTGTPDHISIKEDSSQSEKEKEKEKENPSDVGEVFSDALKVVSTLEDKYTSLVDLQEQPVEEEAGKKKKNKRKDKAKKKNAHEAENDSEKKKKGIFARLFEKKVEKSQNENAVDEAIVQMDETSVPIPTAEKKEKKKEKKKTEEQKNKKEKKKKKSKASLNSEESDQAQPIEAGKAKKDKDKSKKEKKERKQKNKDKKKEKSKEKNKQVIQETDSIDEEEGKINWLGAAIVILLFGIMTATLLVGTNTFTYYNMIHSAQKDFNAQKYTQAYDSVSGLKIKDKDVEFYNKIRTVMLVNRELDAYHNYYDMRKYPEALDCLLTGMQRYHKYRTMAKIYGINNDIDLLEEQIESELSSVFGLSPEEATKIIDSKNNDAYSSQIYDIVSKMKKH